MSPRARRDARRPPAPATPPAPAFPQRAGASPKQLVLFELTRGRAKVQSALNGMAPATAERRPAAGGWTVREHVLHLIARDEARLRELERTLAGEPASWMGLEGAAMDALNARELAPLAALGWDAALRRLDDTRARLLEALAAVPDDPPERWSGDHPFGAMLVALHRHDVHPAGHIQHERIGAAAPAAPRRSR